MKYGNLRWRYSRWTKDHYWEDDRYGYADISRNPYNGNFVASGMKGSKEFKLLRDAKKYIEGTKGK